MDEQYELQAKVSLRDGYEFDSLQASDIFIEKADENQFPEISRFRVDDELVKIYQIQSVDDKPYCIHELITYLDKDINKERLQNLESVYDISGVEKGINNLQFMSNIITIEKPVEIIDKYFPEVDDPYLAQQEVGTFK